MSNKFSPKISANELSSGNEDYIKQNLEFMEFVQQNKCKTKELKYGKK